MKRQVGERWSVVVFAGESLAGEARRIIAEERALAEKKTGGKIWMDGTVFIKATRLLPAHWKATVHFVGGPSQPVKRPNAAVATA